MTRDIVFVAEDTSVRDAWKAFEETGSDFFVVGDSNRFAGLIKRSAVEEAVQAPECVVLERQLNRMIAATRNKASALFSTAAIHIDHLLRTFGQHVAHIAHFNYLWCSQAKGEANPNAGRALEKELKTKAEFVKAVTAAFAYCDPVYAALTDASGAEVVTITQENGNKQQQTRMGLLMLNVVHNNEVYGSMVTTLRIKNISPQPPPK